MKNINEVTIMEKLMKFVKLDD